MDSATSPISGSASRLRLGAAKHLTRQRPTRLPAVNQRRGSLILPRPPNRSNTDWWYRNINRLSIDYASRPRLRSRLTLGGLTFPRKPWAFGGRVSHPSFATHTGILSSLRSIDKSLTGNPYGSTSPPRECSPTHHARRHNAAASVSGLSPATLSARNHLTSELLRTLSMVAASKPTSWLSVQFHILSHLARIRDLSWRSGLFPSRPWSLSPTV